MLYKMKNVYWIVLPLDGMMWSGLPLSRCTYTRVYYVSSYCYFWWNDICFLIERLLIFFAMNDLVIYVSEYAGHASHVIRKTIWCHRVVLDEKKCWWQTVWFRIDRKGGGIKVEEREWRGTKSREREVQITLNDRTQLDNSWCRTPSEAL